MIGGSGEESGKKLVLCHSTSEGYWNDDIAVSAHYASESDTFYTSQFTYPLSSYFTDFKGQCPSYWLYGASKGGLYSDEPVFQQHSTYTSGYKLESVILKNQMPTGLSIADNIGGVTKFRVYVKLGYSGIIRKGQNPPETADEAYIHLDFECTDRTITKMTLFVPTFTNQYVTSSSSNREWGGAKILE